MPTELLAKMIIMQAVYQPRQAFFYVQPTQLPPVEVAKEINTCKFALMFLNNKFLFKRSKRTK